MNGSFPGRTIWVLDVYNRIAIPHKASPLHFSYSLTDVLIQYTRL